MTVLRSGSATDVGRVRSVNEDLAFEGSTLFAVADGMGGHAGGEVAARTAIDSLRARFERATSADGLVDAIREANHAVWEKGHEDPSLRGMGTTLVTAGIVHTEQGDRLVVANVGDSRAYRLNGDDFGQVSVDHSVAEELVARGELSEREAALHPHRHILTRALGVDSDVDVDCFELVPEEGDRFLLCSDGLTNEVSPEEIHRVLASTRDPQDAAGTLVRLANESGGNDNITAVVLDVLSVEGASSDGSGQPATGIMVPAGAPAAQEAPPAEDEAAPGLMARSEESAREGAPADATREPSPEHRTAPRRITFRVILFVLVLGGLAYAGWAAVHWYVDNSYYVGVSHGRVVIFEGRRGGFLGFQPKVVHTSGIAYGQLPTNLQTTLNSGVEEPSRKAASSYVQNLQSLLCAESPPPAGLACAPTPAPSAPTTLPPATPAPSAIGVVRVTSQGTSQNAVTPRNAATPQGPERQAMGDPDAQMTEAA